MRAARSVTGVLSIGLLLSAMPMPARAGGECPLEDLESGVWPYLSRHVSGGNQLANLFFDAPEPTTNLLFDDPGDAVNRAGNPAEGLDVLCAAPFVVSAGGESVYETLGLDLLADDDNVVVVAPVTPSEALLNATELIFEPVAAAALPDPLGMQLGNGFGGGSAPNYENPGFIELDGAHTWPGVFFANDRWNLDLTEYRDGGFTQGESGDLIFVIGPDWWLKIKVPPAPDFADTWRSYAVAGNVVDVIDLGSWQPQALPQVSLTQLESTPTPAAAAPAETATASPSPSGSPTGATPPASTTTDDGPPVVPIVVGGLVAAGLIAGAIIFARTRRREAASISEMASEFIAADVARTALVSRAGKETGSEAGRQSGVGGSRT
jgi:glycoprotein J